MRASDRKVHIKNGTFSTNLGEPEPLIYLDRDTGILRYRPEGDGSWSTVSGSITGVGADYKIARGTTALDGSNPTPVATGLTTVVAFIPALAGTSAPGDNTSVLTVGAFTAGSVDVYAWKNTDGTDPTLVASTGTESIYWIAIGT